MNGQDVYGVTLVDDELFVLLYRDDNQVAVYNINDYKPLRHLHLPGLKPSIDNDMTSSVLNKCLYISDPINCCVLRFVLSSKVSALKKLMTSKRISKWSVPGRPCGLSVTPAHNLLATCRGPTSKLVELSTDSGQCVREITLQSDIQYMWHAVQLTTGQFVICHGGENQGLHRVCLVDVKGKVTLSYGGQPGSGIRQLDNRRHLAVDETLQFIFVADWFNKRVVLLNPALEFVSSVRNCQTPVDCISITKHVVCM